MEKTHKTTQPSGPRRLFRSRNDRILAGVAGGLGDYFDIDPVIIRIIFMILTVFGGSGFMMYIILWLVIPDESDLGLQNEDVIHANMEEMKQRAKQIRSDFHMKRNQSPHSRGIFGVFLVVLGLIFLATTLGFIDGEEIRHYWPLILIAIGFFIFMKDDRSTPRPEKETMKEKDSADRD